MPTYRIVVEESILYEFELEADSQGAAEDLVYNDSYYHCIEDNRLRTRVEVMVVDEIPPSP